jgi:hypothetical protein
MRAIFTAKMNSSSIQICRTGARLLALLLTFTSPLFADSELAEKSPFLPPGYGEKPEEKPKPPVQTQGPISREIEFRGFVKLNGVFQFSLTNKKLQKSYWLKEGEGEAGITVSNYDPESSSIVVLVNGRSERLTMLSASDSPLPVAQSKLTSPNKNRPPVLPPQLRNNANNNSTGRKVVPRRRVILPKKN